MSATEEVQILAKLRGNLFCGQSIQTTLDEGSLLPPLLDAISAAVHGTLSVTSVVQLLKEWKTGIPDATISIQPIINCIMSSLWAVGSQSKASSSYSAANLTSLVKEIIGLGLIDATLLKSTLELQTLADCGLIRDAEQPVQRIIKINTGLVYKQQKYNLLREETEGYSKLLMALINVPVNSQDCQMVIDSVRSIIGQFDLDPNRTFDIILDCFEQHPTNSSYLSILSALKPVNLVHNLGFKFTHYHSEAPISTATPIPATPTTANATTTTKSATATATANVKSAQPEEERKEVDSVIKDTPKSLFTVAATLITAGMVSMDELLPYLDPTIDVTAKYLIEKEKEILKIYKDSKFDAKLLEKFHFCHKDLSMRKGSTWQLGKASTNTSNLGSASSGLAPGVNNTSAIGSSKAPPPPPPVLTLPTSVKDNKPIPLVRDRLKEKEAKAVEEEDLHLNEFSFFPCGNDKQYAQIIDETGHQILGLIAALLQVHGWRQAKSLLLLLENLGVQLDSLLLCCPSVRSELLLLVSWSLNTVYAQCNPICGRLSTSKAASGSSCDVVVSGINFDRFQQIQSFDSDFFSVVWELVDLLGIHLAENSILFTKLCRLLKSWIAAKNETEKDLTADQQRESYLNNALKLMLLLLQNLSVSGVDATYYASQLWQSISLLKFEDRFVLYEVWKESSDSSPASHIKLGMKLAQAFAMQTIRREMKRLTKETSKKIGQNLAKFMHANPIVFIEYMLMQVENFDNLIPYIIEALRFSMDLSRDVFAFSILRHLNEKINDKKIKDADTHYYPWFIAISKFTASFYCKFAGTEIKGLFHYLLKSFSNGQAADLLILRDLLGIMGGSTTLLELSHSQLDGLAGGKNLRAEALGLATSVTMSGGKSSALSTKKSATVLRDELIASRVALPLLLFIAQMRSNVIYESSNSHLKLISFFFDNVQDLLMQFADFLIGEAKSMDMLSQLMPPFNVLLEDVGLSLPVAFQLVRPLMRHALQQQSVNNQATSVWLPFDENLNNVVREHAASQDLWNVVSIRFYMLFWSLSLYDISAPTEKYQYEIKRIKDKYAEMDKKKATATAQSMNMTENELTKWRKQREADMKQMMITVAALSEELASQKKHCDQIKELLSLDKQSLIVNGAPNVTSMILQHFILPRVMMSPADAVFCVRFCKALHELEVPNFCLLEFYNGFISLILPLLFAATETEAKVIGHALNEILFVVNRWRKGQTLFQIETKSKCILFNGESSSSTTPIDSENKPAAVVVNHKKFVEMTKGWHTKILDVVYNAINGKEFIYIRTALIFLTKVSPQFPFLKSEGNRLLQRVQKLEKDENERGDLQLMAKSVLTILKHNSGTWFDDEPPATKKPPSAPSTASGTKNSSNNSGNGILSEPASSKVKVGKTEGTNEGSGSNNASKNNNLNSNSSNKSGGGSVNNTSTKTNDKLGTTASDNNNNGGHKMNEKATSSTSSNTGNSNSNSSSNSNNRKNQVPGTSQPGNQSTGNPPKNVNNIDAGNKNNVAANSNVSNTTNSNTTTTNSNSNNNTNNNRRERSSSKQRSTQPVAATGSANNTTSIKDTSNIGNSNKRKASDAQTEGLPPTKVARQQSSSKDGEGSNKDDPKKNNGNNNQSKKEEQQSKKTSDAKKEDVAAPPPSKQESSRNAASKTSGGSSAPPPPPPSHNQSVKGPNSNAPSKSSSSGAPPPPPGPPPAPQLSVHGHVNYGSGRGNNYAPPPPSIPPHPSGYNTGGRYNDGYDNRGDYDPYDPYRARGQDYDYNRRPPPPPPNSSGGSGYRQQDHPDHYYKKPRN